MDMDCRDPGLGIGGLIYYRKQQAAEAAAKGQSGAGKPQRPDHDSNRDHRSAYINALGTVTSVYTASITTRVNGQIVSVNYPEGQMVRKGDVLMEIDPRPPTKQHYPRHRERWRTTKRC